MPKSNRPGTDVREHFNYTTPGLSSKARPLDPYVSPETPNKDAQLVGDALTSMGKILGTLKTIKREKEADKRSKAASRRARKVEERRELAAKKKADREAADLDFISKQIKKQGSEEYKKRVEWNKGQRDFLSYEKDTKLLLDKVEDGTVDYDTGLAELDKLAQKYTNGKEKAYLSGFVPEAVKQEEKIKTSFGLAQRKHIREDLLIDIRQHTAAFLKNTPITDTLPSALREKLSSLQKEYKELGIKTPSVSEAFVDVVSNIAIQAGMPELLEFTGIKDKSNIALKDTDLGDDIRVAIKAAENTRDFNLKAIEKEKKANTKRKAASFEADIASRIYEVDEASTVASLRAEVVNAIKNEELATEDGRPLLNYLDDFVDSAFPETSSDTGYKVYIQALKGEAGYPGLSQAAQSGIISRADYTAAIKAIASQKKAATKEKTPEQSMLKTAHDEQYASLKNLFSVRDEAFIKDATLLMRWRLRRDFAITEWNKKKIEYFLNNDYTYPPYKTLLQWKKDISDTIKDNEELSLVDKYGENINTHSPAAPIKTSGPTTPDSDSNKQQLNTLINNITGN